MSGSRVVAAFIGVELAIATLLRLVLVLAYGSTAAWSDVAAIVVFGALFDGLAALTAFLPFIAIASISRGRWVGRWFGRLFITLVFFALCFDAFVQFFFFDEYSARYNHLALDYLMYPDEVFGNIFASYNVALYAAIAIAAAIGLTWWLSRSPGVERPPLSARDRIRGIGKTAVLSIAIWAAWFAMPSTVRADRMANELALNGWAELVRAFLTSDLDYAAYYAMLPQEEAVARVTRLIGQPDPERGLVRHFAPRSQVDRPRDVIVIMEESLGSIFSHRFGGEQNLAVTPELDRWSHEGIALTNLIANGNRTVRGIEGILCSFLPLPPDSIVKRDLSRNLGCLPGVLAAHGYETTFFTGGYGMFDNMKPFMTANGFAHFVEQPDYPRDAFRSTWGVADEYVFDEMLRRHLEASKAGRPWFGAVITVSNHKPFEVPAGRVSWPADQSRRRGAMLYADWALGRYLTQAKQRGLLDHTVVLIVGDHGSRVYGAEEIPVTSYRVPAVFLTPDAGDRGRTIDRLTSQVDLAPTVLSLAGVAYDAPFFGRDLLGLPPDGGRAFVNHNRSIGLLTDTSLAVLGLHQTVRNYTRPNRQSDTFTETAASSATVELARDAEAAFQVANSAYRDRRYSLPESKR